MFNSSGLSSQEPFDILSQIFAASCLIKAALSSFLNALDKEIEESWTELKKLESLVEKKKELTRKLPEQGSQSLKAPVSEGSVVTHKTVAEVHVADGGTARYVPKPGHKTSQSGRARSPPTSQ